MRTTELSDSTLEARLWNSGKEHKGARDNNSNYGAEPFILDSGMKLPYIYVCVSWTLTHSIACVKKPV